MSSYLLLRNNKESGPFTMDEVKSMSLNSYDLIWVVGKSAAWRYPGEIPELKSFVPSTPDPKPDYFRKGNNMDSQGSDSLNTKIADSLHSHRPVTNNQRSASNRTVYINLPAEKKQGEELSNLTLEESGFMVSDTSKSEYDFSEIYKLPSTAAARYSGKILWVSTIILLFGAGIMTGLFISDRRKIFSSDENHPQKTPALQGITSKIKNENATGSIPTGQTINNNEIKVLNPDSVKKTNAITKKQNTGSLKKVVPTNVINKDSTATEQALLAAIRVKDSIQREAVRKSELLSQAIRTNPQKFLSLSTGRYSTGLFGGISSFPVTLTNNSPVKIEMVEVTIDYVQNNDKVYKTETLSFNGIEPGEALTLKAPKSTRGTKITSQIRIVNVHQPDSVPSN